MFSSLELNPELLLIHDSNFNRDR